MGNKEIDGPLKTVGPTKRLAKGRKVTMTLLRVKTRFSEGRRWREAGVPRDSSGEHSGYGVRNQSLGSGQEGQTVFEAKSGPGCEAGVGWTPGSQGPLLKFCGTCLGEIGVPWL